MSLKIKIKRISGVPSTSDLESGEIGLNTSNNQLYINISGTITSVSSSGGGGSMESTIMLLIGLPFAYAGFMMLIYFSKPLYTRLKPMKGA